MLQAIGHDAKRKRFGSLDGFLACLSISLDTGQVDHLGDPTPVVFTFYFDVKHIDPISPVSNE